MSTFDVAALASQLQALRARTAPIATSLRAANAASLVAHTAVNPFTSTIGFSNTAFPTPIPAAAVAIATEALDGTAAHFAVAIRELDAVLGAGNWVTKVARSNATYAATAALELRKPTLGTQTADRAARLLERSEYGHSAAARVLAEGDAVALNDATMLRAHLEPATADWIASLIASADEDVASLLKIRSTRA